MANMKTVIEALMAEGYLPPEKQAELAGLLANEEASTTWYIQAAVGISAWIAALFIIGFIVSGVILTQSALAYSITGLIFCAAAVGVKHLFSRSIFAGQLTLAISLAGQGLFVAGVYLGTESLLATCLITILMEAALILLYPGKLHRFISALILLGAILTLLYAEWEMYEATHLLVILLMSLAILIWHEDTYFVTLGLHPLSRPLGYAATLTLFGLLLPSVIYQLNYVKYWWISTLGLLVATLILFIFLIPGRGSLNFSLTVTAATAGGVVILGLITWQTPGILASLTLLLLGFWRGHRLVWGLAVAFLAFFIAAFYYNLTLSLYEKSLILVGSGALLFLARYIFLNQFKPVQEAG
jgi:hypothetical protein